jgi:hypothetical protein
MIARNTPETEEGFRRAYTAEVFRITYLIDSFLLVLKFSRRLIVLVILFFLKNIVLVILSICKTIFLRLI